MNLPPQPPSPEESEQQPALHSSEETPTQPASSSEPNEAQTSTPEDDKASTSDEDTVSTLYEDEAAASNEDTVSALYEDEATPSDEDEVVISNLDEDEDFELAQPGSSLSNPSLSGIFIPKAFLIAAASAVVAIALVVALLVFINRPKDPPTDWIASYTAPASSGSTGKTLYYLHWTNKNGELNGQLQLAANPSGTLQSLSAIATGLYNRDNHIIYVVVIVNGQPDTLTGKINDNNDTLTLTLAGASSQDGQLVFHIGSANDYKQATQKLGSTKK